MSNLLTTAIRTDPALIDENVLSEFITFMGEDGDALAKDLVALYLKKTPTLIAKIEADINANDIEILKGHIHSLKGSSAQLGIIGISNVCRSIENVISLKQFKEINPQFNLLVNNYKQIEQIYAERL
jgi:HPt (histidine-containing phosphotransfer) domain-containing protein